MRIALIVPPNTPVNKPVTATGNFIQGDRITLERVIILKGHAYLTGIQINAGRRGDVIVPAPGSNTNWISGDGDTLEYHYEVPIEQVQNTVKIFAYNLDDTYPHTFFVDLE